MLDKSYPKVSKGIAMPELSMPIGGALYSFKLSEIADKVTAKDKATGTTVTARYKKDTKKFDIAYTAKYSASLDYLLK